MSNLPLGTAAQPLPIKPAITNLPSSERKRDHDDKSYEGTEANISNRNFIAVPSFHIRQGSASLTEVSHTAKC